MKKKLIQKITIKRHIIIATTERSIVPKNFLDTKYHETSYVRIKNIRHFFNASIYIVY